MSARTPSIVFFHRNHSWYLPYVLNQARHASPESDVVLIGQDTGIDGIKHVAIAEFEDVPEIKRFRAAFRCMSGNGYEYELFCYLRWFYMLQYMNQSGVESAFYLDSDVLLYSPASEIASWLGNDSLCALSIPDQKRESKYWCASGHTSYWTKPLLASFCDFALRSYTDTQGLRLYEGKWASYKAEGVSDMTTLYLFWLNNRSSIVNSSQRRHGAVIDHNINASSNYSTGREYRTSWDHKKVDFSGELPHFLAGDDGQHVLAHALHCQGRAKSLIPLYYQGVPFAGKEAADHSSLRARRSLYALYPVRKALRLLRRATKKDEAR